MICGILVFKIGLTFAALQNIIDESDIEAMRKYMKFAIDEAMVSLQSGYDGIGVVIVDPRSRKILARSRELLIKL